MELGTYRGKSNLFLFHCPPLVIQLRDQARALGIPFVSVNEASVTELEKSLLPVFDLYSGRLAVEDIKGSRRIRI